MNSENLTCFEENAESEVGKLLPGEVSAVCPGGAAPDAGEAGHEGPHPGGGHRVPSEASLEVRGHRGQQRGQAEAGLRVPPTLHQTQHKQRGPGRPQQRGLAWIMVILNYYWRNLV